MTSYLFDVCHTLYPVNTTYGFLAQVFAGDERYEALARRRRSIISRVASRLGEEDAKLREEFIALLAGQSREHLVHQAERFVSAQPEITPTMEMLRQAQARGEDVRLISGSLSVLVEAVAKQLGVKHYYSSELSFAGDLCEGRLVQDLEGQKADIIRRDLPDQEVIMVSDNFSDANCIPLVRAFHPVYPRGHFRATWFWRFKPVAPAIRYDL